MILGRGEFATRAAATAYARKAWFKAIAAVTPEVLEAFREMVWDNEPQLRTASGEEYETALRGLISQWAKKFHINEDWVRTSGLNTIMHWKKDAEAQEDVRKIVDFEF
ncbi:MAG TPA: hypothetical protein VMG82_24620 [Candidatus Sulfotelmatobacter sp.]|nr:hypothetical protein [Candidatus Sulfotelmatobacter sp.]